MARTAVKPVVVGIDGSRQAGHAALWAVGEAIGQGVPLRLVYVVRTDLTGPLSAEQYRTAVDAAKLALHAVRSELEAGRPVTVETEIAEGSPAGVLLAESEDATMICVGSSGLGWLGRAMLGSTAAALAERASCPVAIIRSPKDAEQQEEHTKWVMIPVSVFADNELITAAVDQARLLRRPVLAVGVRHPDLGSTPYDALDGLVAQWQTKFPDVHIYPVSDDTGMSQFVKTHPELGGLVVIDAESADDVSSIVGGEHHGHSPHAERAVLVARNYAVRQSPPMPSVRC